MKMAVRVLSKHPSYKKEEVPCILIAGKQLIKKYGWKVGDKVRVDLEEDGVRIYKIEQVSMEQIKKDNDKVAIATHKLKEDGTIIAGDEK